MLRELLAAGDPGRWPADLRPALRTTGFADELRNLLMRAVERGLDGPGLRALGRARGRADWVAAGEFLAEYHSVYAHEGSRRLRHGRAHPRRAQRPARRPRPARGRARAPAADLRRRVPGHRPGAGRAAAAAGRGRRRARAGRRPRPVDLRLPRRRRVGHPRGRRALRRRRRGAGGRAAAAAGARARRCWPPPAGWPPGCPAGPSSARSRPPTACRRAGPTSPSSGPRARKRPTSPGCCARRISTACPGRRWRCSSAPPR